MSWNDCSECDSKEMELQDSRNKVNDLESQVQDLENEKATLEREKDEWRTEYYQALEESQTWKA